MADVFNIDWREVLVPDTPLLEIFIRGTLVYLGVFLLLRVVFKRQASSEVGITDLIVVVFVADAAQNAMAGDYRSVPDGLLLVATLVFWAFALDWIGDHSSVMERLLKPAPLPLVQNGQMLWKNMKKELVTEQELLSQLRLQGIEDVSEVKRACMEPNGQISVVRSAGGNGQQQRDRQKSAATTARSD